MDIQSFIINEISKTLEIPDIDINKKFEELGGDSLAVVEIRGEINNKYNVDVDYSTFLDKTVREICDIYMAKIAQKGK
ncbi:expressed protein [Dictyostelium purpureum]|uniref:Expressed protein n=1 Tax=Dictyostelium purpureum TaxID=5786 RepID=F0ZHZ9_DICPU|nr:uncharacterized protein DICPUDRAFT_94312 [Dictyostelium purpureum]EGC36423.1 expressed protein [Dictyostelium purpureum]|eukprot:XP_003287056.1 expressed protein [Dictyostelium purpureum]